MADRPTKAEKAIAETLTELENSPKSIAEQIGEPSEHDQHVARDRRTDQLAGEDGGRWGPTGQSRVGGP